jgi:hypothetical protein
MEKKRWLSALINNNFFAIFASGTIQWEKSGVVGWLVIG